MPAPVFARAVAIGRAISAAQVYRRDAGGAPAAQTIPAAVLRRTYNKILPRYWLSPALCLQRNDEQPRAAVHCCNL